jgi:hypothetical protein
VFQGLSNLLTKLKNLLLPSKNKPMRSTTSREISSTNRLRQYRQQSPIYDVLPSSSSLIINHGISLPFTYYSNSPIRQSRANFEKIAAWLNHTDKLKYNSNEFLFIDTHQQPSSSHVIDNQGKRKKKNSTLLVHDIVYLAFAFNSFSFSFFLSLTIFNSKIDSYL